MGIATVPKYIKHSACFASSNCGGLLTMNAFVRVTPGSWLMGCPIACLSGQISMCPEACGPSRVMLTLTLPPLYVVLFVPFMNKKH
jgi:hypothetical protein